MRATDFLANAGDRQMVMRDVCDVFSTNIFKRIHVEDPAYGYAYFSGSELFQIAPTPRGYLSRKAPGIREYVVHADWLLIQDAGQLGGLIGQLTRVPAQLDGVVVSNHLMRIVPRSRIDAGYLFAVLGSPLGYRAITRNAFGSSIPQLDPAHISAIKIPWPDEADREKIANPVLDSWNLDDHATSAELEAVNLVERTIEGFA
jgi:type I restriction enzyme S subunit